MLIVSYRVSRAFDFTPHNYNILNSLIWDGWRTIVWRLFRSGPPEFSFQFDTQFTRWFLTEASYIDVRQTKSTTSLRRERLEKNKITIEIRKSHTGIPRGANMDSVNLFLSLYDYEL